MNFAEILTSPEGKTLEFKRDTSALKQIMRTIVAFANTAGGSIIIGRQDDGGIIGVEDPLLMEEQLSNAIADSSTSDNTVTNPADTSSKIFECHSKW